MLISCSEWRSTLGVICDIIESTSQDYVRILCIVVPRTMYGTECWTVKSQQENKLNVAG